MQTCLSPSLAEPDLVMQGKKENETCFWDQGRKMGITPLHCYFQPEIS